jgi:hypothetical protein
MHIANIILITHPQRKLLLIYPSNTWGYWATQKSRTVLYPHWEVTGRRLGLRHPHSKTALMLVYWFDLYHFFFFGLFVCNSLKDILFLYLTSIVPVIMDDYLHLKWYTLAPFGSRFIGINHIYVLFWFLLLPNAYPVSNFYQMVPCLLRVSSLLSKIKSFS